MDQSFLNGFYESLPAAVVVGLIGLFYHFKKSSKNNTDLKLDHPEFEIMKEKYGYSGSQKDISIVSEIMSYNKIKSPLKAWLKYKEQKTENKIHTIKYTSKDEIVSNSLSRTTKARNVSKKKIKLVIIWVALILIVLVFVFPHWYIGTPSNYRSYGYHFLVGYSPRRSVQIDYKRAFYHWATIILVSGTLIWLTNIKDK